MKVLRVGDPHVTIRNLDEAKKLLNFIFIQATTYKVDRIEFLGDLFHNHAVIRVEVLDFWQKALKDLAYYQVVMLVGNHDQPGSKELEQEMNALKVLENVGNRVVDSPTIIDGIAYIPYMSNKEDFIKAAQELYNQGAEKLLVAHQNFTVPLYSDMIDQNLIPQQAIITGHIHEQRQIGKVFQVGTPKWDTLTDANEDKGIWIYDHAQNGSVISKQFISTKGVVTPITKKTLNEGDVEITLDPNDRNYLELIGSSAWIIQMKKKYKGLAAITARPSDRKSVNINKDKAFSMFGFLDASFKPIDGVEKQDIKKYLEEVINVGI